jgi:uncharacterized protein (UPF0276 family)
MQDLLNQRPLAGLGLRRCFLDQVLDAPPQNIGFYEVAPENWMTVGGKMGKQFRAITEQHTFVCHGLSLSLGSSDPLDEDFVRNIKSFMKTHGIRYYSEHLSYCSHEGHLYDLMPIPFTEAAVRHVAERIQRVQDILGHRMAVENVSYYAEPGKEMDEIDFFNAVVQQADCHILIDINNIYVNSVNHGYDAERFLQAIPHERIAYAHIAGHYKEADDFLIDTHGAGVIDPVWDLLAKSYQTFGLFPTLLERDFNIPELSELLEEVDMIHRIQQQALDSATCPV